MNKRKGEKKPESQEAEAAGDEPQNKFPLHEHIGRQLKATFDEVVSQPVPEKFRELLEQLERKQAKK
jgi:hypothetical protein